MTEITVESTDNPDEVELEEQDEHDAAREAGAAEVHKERAEEAAAEAEAAAETVADTVSVNVDQANMAMDAATRAEDAANAANSGAHAVAEAITAQTAVLQSLLEKLESAPKEESTPPADGEPVKKTKDRAPERQRRSGIGRRYYGG